MNQKCTGLHFNVSHTQGSLIKKREGDVAVVYFKAVVCCGIFHIRKYICLNVLYLQ